MIKLKLILTFVLGVYSSTALSHGDEVLDDTPKEEDEMPMSEHSGHHDEANHMMHNSPDSEKPSDQSQSGASDSATLAKIDSDYQKYIMPIFKKACFNCHSSKTKYPWYYKLPIAKGIIDADIKEAKKHLEMGDSFPFAGHGGPYEDLKAIKNSIDEGTMPPFKYQIMHWKSFLGPEEKKAITQWAKDGMDLLEK